MEEFAPLVWTDEEYNRELGRARRLNLPVDYALAMCDVRRLIIGIASRWVFSN